MNEPTKQPIIRKGQRKPYAKATRQQIEERIQAAASLCASGLSKPKIHALFRQRFGLEWRQTDRYMAYARAREERRERSLGNLSVGGGFQRSRESVGLSSSMREQRFDGVPAAINGKFSLNPA